VEEGLYEKARQDRLAGELPGVTAPYETPENPEIEIPTHEFSAREAAQQIVAYIAARWMPAASMETDRAIRERIRQSIASDPQMEALDLGVYVNDGRVSLEGTVDAYWKKQRAHELAATHSGAGPIENDLAVVPTRKIVDRTIAEEIIDSLESRPDLQADEVIVHVRHGHVTLTGRVSGREAGKAVEKLAALPAGVTGITNRLTGK
jgi:osmotically-inducible protein OsmY